MVDPITAGLVIGFTCAIGGYLIGFLSCVAIWKMIDKMGK